MNQISEINFKEILVEALQKHHNLERFDCGDDDISEFLKKDALNWQRQKNTRVHLFIHNEEIIGFFSLSCDSIKLKESEKSKHPKMENSLKEFPAMKIGRLGVDKKWQRCGLGTKILMWAIGYISHHSDNSIACRFVTIDAYPHMVEWYKKRSFVENQQYGSKKRETVSMRYDLFNEKV